jgi:opacity protein-like surface antigen
MKLPSIKQLVQIMKKIVFLLGSSLFFTNMANAQTEQINWTGWYVGAGINNFSGHNTDRGYRYDLKEAYTPELHIGYNHELTEKLVMGAEISGKLGKDKPHEWGYESYKYTTLIDYKIKAGYKYGSFLPYATIGYSNGKFLEQGSRSYNISGYLLGLGIGYQINESWQTDLGMISRKFNDLYQQNSEHGTAKTLTAKISYKF